MTHKTWVVVYICCGRDYGLRSYHSEWAEADRFREDYCRAAGHHDRVGIIREHSA